MNSVHKSANKSATSSIDQVASYQDWIATHTFQRADGADFEKRMQEWRNTPRFHIAIVLDTDAVPALGASLQSLAGQYYPNLLVTVAAPLPSPGNLPAERLVWIETGTPWAAANDALQASADGTWVGLVRAGDTLAPHALLAIAEYLHTHPETAAIYTDEDIQDAEGKRHTPGFKPDFDREWLYASGYVGNLLLTKSETLRDAGGWLHFSDNQDEFDLALRLVEQLPANAFGHVADVLYHRSADHPVLAEKLPEQPNPRQTHLQRHLARVSPQASVTTGLTDESLRVIHPLPAQPRISILIPADDRPELLQRCLESLFEQADHPDIEILIVGDTTLGAAACAFLKALDEIGDARIRILHAPLPAPRNARFNLAAEAATGNFLLLLNPEVSALHQGWLGEMLALAQRPAVGAVGARLLGSDGTLRHAGYVLGLNGSAGSPFAGQSAEAPTPFSQTQVQHRVSAASSDCLLIQRNLYLDVGGMDTEHFPQEFGDIDLCLKVANKGLEILWTPYATLLHDEAPEAERAKIEASAATDVLYQRWMPRLIRDGSTNPNLSLSDPTLPPEPESALTWNPTPWNPHPRILVHPVNQDGSGQYRILQPIRGLHDAARCRGYASKRLFSPVEIAKAEMTSIVIQVPTKPAQLKGFETYHAASGAFCIAEVDDLITEIPHASPLYHVIGKNERDHFRRALQIADRLVVTTEPLAAAYADLCADVRVAKNYLPGAIWNSLKPSRKAGGKPRVGWAGSISHMGDLALLSEIVKKLAKEVDWVFFGACRQELLPYVKDSFVGVTFDRYPETLAAMGLDLAIAPLEDNRFNECKSPLKLLEYGILGYPVVCTNSLPYRGDFPVTRVPNKPAAWIAAIRERIHDLDATHREGEELQAHIRQHWMLEDHLDEWLSAWMPAG